MNLKNIKALAIIPAKTDSTRLKKKNLRIVDGKTLVEHAIEYAINSNLVNTIVVTSESKEVHSIVKKYKDVLFFHRDNEYMGEREVADVYVNVVQEDLKKYDNSIIPTMSPTWDDLDAAKLEKAMDKIDADFAVDFMEEDGKGGFNVLWVDY